MNHDEFVKSVISNIPNFLNNLRDHNYNLYKFCLDGDLHRGNPLSSSVFVSKIFYMLNIHNKKTSKVLNEHIVKFYKKKEKQIFDHNIKNKSLFRRIAKSLAYRKLRYFSY